MKIGIIIINWNSPQYLQHQIISIRKFLGVDDIYVFETTKERKCDQISANNRVSYHHMPLSGDFSISHATALNFAYNHLSQHSYDIIGIIDHDCFPFSEYNIVDMLGEYDVRAEEQIRGDVLYPNTTCIFVRGGLNVNFMPIEGLDTGGQLSSIYKTECRMNRTEGPYGIEILDKSFMHIGKGSNWIGTEDNKDRIEKAFEYIKSYVNLSP